MSEQIEILHQQENIRIERITSFGDVSPAGFWYDQSETEWIILLQGTAILRFQHKTITLASGDHTFINSHEKHRVDYTSTNPPCIWLCVFVENTTLL